MGLGNLQALVLPVMPIMLGFPCRTRYPQLPQLRETLSGRLPLTGTHKECSCVITRSFS